MGTDNKYGRLLFSVVTVLFIIAIGVCLIVDFAINRRIVWAGMPIISIIFAWIVVLPLFLAKRHKLIFSLMAATIVTIPFLFLLERLVPIKNWFYSIGLNVALISIVSIWITFVVFKYVKISIWFKSAITVFLFGVIVSTATNYYVNVYLGV